MCSHGVPDPLDTPVLIPNEEGGEMGPRGTMKIKMTLVLWLVFPISLPEFHNLLFIII